ncbi:MAG: hypothetical protein ACOYLU_08220, partial [Limisphaerales bacterium]
MSYLYSRFSADPQLSINQLERIRAAIADVRPAPTGTARLSDDPRVVQLFERFRMERPRAAPSLFPAGDNDLTLGADK